MKNKVDFKEKRGIVMKTIKSLSLGAVALLLGVAPVASLVNPLTTTAQAATKKAAGTITVGNNSDSNIIGVYNAAGKQKNQRIKNGTVFKYYGAPKLINYEYTYKIAKNKYVPTSAISELNGKGVLYIAKNSYVYDKNGKRVTKYGVSKKAVLLRKSQIVNYTASLKAANADSFRFLVDNNGNKTVLTYKNIKGHQYYSVGKNAYVRVANVSYVDNKPLYAAFQTVTLGKHNNDTKVPVYDAEGKASKKVLTAGDKVEVDRTKTVKSGKETLILYGVKGQKDSYLDMNDIASLPDLAVLLEK